jgi:N-acyl-D-aspartate/D-glutamate deacylase
MTQQHDLVIRGGTVVDGTGTAPRHADVAIDGGRITTVGEVAGTGREELDATGLLVTPGWVDVHTHYDGQVSWDDLLTPSSWHGVTTAVMGNCGVGFAPVHPDKHNWLIELMEGVEDIPGTALHEGISWGWESFPEYLDIVEARARTIDVAGYIPHAALRGYVMGERGGDHDEAPTPAEIVEMGRLVAEAVRAGAIGFSTSRTINHKSADGRHTPTLTAPAEELLGIAKAMGETGAGVFEVVADLFDLDTEMGLLRAMAEVSGRPLSIAFAQRPEFPPDEYTRILGHLDAANAAGVTMVGQVPARPVGLIMSLEGRVNPLVTSATYMSTYAERPLAERVAALRDPDIRATIVAELEATRAHNPLIRFEIVAELGETPIYDPTVDDDVRELARRAGRSPFDYAIDVLLSHDGTGLLYVPVNNYLEKNLRVTRELLSHLHTVPGLGDAGAHCTMICDASMPTYMLSHWARDAADDQRMPIEWAVKRQCADTAALVGLLDRGVLAPGYKADVNLIDLDALGVGRPEMLYDLPAGGKRLVQRPTGYRATIVSGSIVFRDGVDTGARPGRLVRGGQALSSAAPALANSHTVL